MFETLAYSLRQRRRDRAIKRALRDHQAHIRLLAQTLLPNIAQDDIYRDFPRLPKMPRKEWRSAGLYRFKLLTNFTRDRSDISIRVHRDDEWLGTFISHGLETPHRNLILPQDLISPSLIEAQAEKIFAALMILDAEDTASRNRSYAA